MRAQIRIPDKGRAHAHRNSTKPAALTNVAAKAVSSVVPSVVTGTIASTAASVAVSKHPFKTIHDAVIQRVRLFERRPLPAVDSKFGACLFFSFVFCLTFTRGTDTACSMSATAAEMVVSF